MQEVFARGLDVTEKTVRSWQLPPNPMAAAIHAINAAAARANGGAAAAAFYPPASSSLLPVQPIAAVDPLGCVLALDLRQSGNVARFVRQHHHTYGGTAADPPLVIQV